MERVAVSTQDGEQPPRPGHALEFVLAAISEFDVGADDEVLHGGGDKYLGRAGVVCNSGSDVDRHAGNVIAADLDLTGGDTYPYLEAERLHGVAHRASTLDRSSGSVEDELRRKVSLLAT